MLGWEVSGEWGQRCASPARCVSLQCQPPRSASKYGPILHGLNDVCRPGTAIGISGWVKVLCELAVLVDGGPSRVFSRVRRSPPCFLQASSC